MMLDHLGETQAANLIENAVIQFLASGRLKGLSPSDIKKSGLTTARIGDAVAARAASL
jgi:isocitrate/isopropylmalate dehydrogenase